MNTSLPAGTVLHQRYRIIRRLGQGDFGTVYQARDLRPASRPRFVALKQMPMQMIVNCERQADLAGGLRHPAIPRILGYFVAQQQAYLVKEFIRGITLETALDQAAGFLAERRVIHWAIQLCAALGYLHTHPEHPIVFRDLKPNNIVVDRAERVYLVDFELARAFPPGFFTARPPRWRHLRTGLAIGTAGYSPPEQYRGRVSPASDLYALGASLHHLLTNRDPRRAPPFTFPEHPVRSINPAVSPALEFIIQKALHRKARDRYATAQEMQTALQQVLV